MNEKKLNKAKMEWNVYVHDFNSKEIKIYNVFNHVGFFDGVKKLLKTKELTREEFEEQLRKECGYYYWSKCEWELIITSWPAYVSKEEVTRLRSEGVKYRTHTNLEVGSKIDVYDQLRLNWNEFVSYVWSFR